MENNSMIKRLTRRMSVIGYCLMVMSMVSCIDTVILPYDKTVDEDFWKSKSDVQQMVYGAYNSMLNSAVIERLIVWGDMRSDELMPVTTVSLNVDIQEDLVEINTGNTQPDNRYATWSALYSVINNCNIILSRAADVMLEDPNYTQGDYLADCSQMIALRSLCYFTLVKVFRDVPYTTEAFMNSSQNMSIAQSNPDSVLTACINDLEEAEANSVLASAYADWRRVGTFTRDGIDALLADIYLWRGSMNRDAADYQKAVYYCDKVIESKKQQHQKGMGEIEESEYPLANGQNMFSTLFALQNAEESIFELQFPGYSGSSSDVRNNIAVCNYFNFTRNNTPYLQAPNFFKFGDTSNKSVFKTGTSVNDYRALTYTYAPNGEEMYVRKYVGTNDIRSASAGQESKSVIRAATPYAQNYMFYRLSDVMLMKAEALTAMAADENDINLQVAFNLVREVNARSKINPATDSLRWAGLRNQVDGAVDNKKIDMELMVLAERLREFAFEGKRWYDLMRYNFRNTSVPVDYKSTLAEQAARGVSYVNNYDNMLTLMVRKFSAGDAVKAKMRTEPKLYMPIPEADIKICPQLHQNPVYDSSSNFGKNN